MNAEPLLKITDLDVSFYTLHGQVKVIDSLNLDLKRGEILGVVGESGSGKSVSSLAIMRLLGEQGRIDKGSILLAGRELTSLSEAAMLKVRGEEVSMIFQEPMTSLNPVYTVGFQIAEMFIEHLGMKRGPAKAEALKLMELVSIPAADLRINDYPFQLSGGMRQRIMIAMGLALKPKLLIADEPTTALDVTVQAQILELILRLRDEFQTAVLLITHDMGVIAEMADRVVVMYAGQIVEEAPVLKLFTSPLHPYTCLLLRSIPKVRVKLPSLPVIAGSPVSVTARPSGCQFYPRCPDALELCRLESPPLQTREDGRQARCFRAGETSLSTYAIFRNRG